MSYGNIIKEIGRGAKGARSLDTETARAVFGDMLDGKVPDLELGAILIAMRIKGESIEEMHGFKQAMDARTQPIQLGSGPRCVVLPSYNGARRQANLMPLVALMLSRRGIPTLIQGRHDFASRTNPFALLEALGVKTCVNTQQASEELEGKLVASVPVAQLLPGLDGLLACRTRLGLRNCAHTMAKLLDPAPGRTVRVVAVTHPEYLQRMSSFLLDDEGRAMLLRGTEGEPFANPRRRPRMDVFVDGKAHLAWPAEEGGAPPLEGLPDVPDIAQNAELIRQMLSGAVAIPDPIQQQVETLAGLAS